MARQNTKPRIQAIREIRELREKAEEKLLKLPNVIGSMIAAKVKSGKPKESIGLTIFVSEKISPGQLSTRDRIPKQVTIEGRAVYTDVLEMRPMKPQAALFPGVLMVSDGLEYGTLSSFCRSDYGYFGLTCAHVMGGRDRDPATADPVEIWSPLKRDYVRVGNSLSSFVSAGAGTEDDFGFVDAALFSIDHPELIDRARNSETISTAYPEIGEIVQAQAGTHGALTGTVLGIHQKVENMLIDVCIYVDDPGTFKGDSGTLWKNKAGQPIAIHAYGERGQPQDGSKFSGSMLASRVARLLNIGFLAER